MTSIIAKHIVVAQFWVQDSIFDTSIQPRFINHTMLPVSPLIKQAVERGVAYLVTYKSDWIPAVKNGKGEIVKRAHCRTYDRRIVGSIRGNGRSGYVGFRECFFRTIQNLKTTQCLETRMPHTLLRRKQTQLLTRKCSLQQRDMEILIQSRLVIASKALLQQISYV